MIFKSPHCRVFLVMLTVLSGSCLHGSAQDEPSAGGKSKAAPVRKKDPALAPVEDVAGLPRVLLIGDSISMGYTLPVREKLKGKANVHRPPVNCGATTTGLENLTAWLDTGGAGKKWDLIHFNWGLHDLKYLGPDGKTLSDPSDPASKQQVPPDQYRENLQKLVEQLKATGAILIWRNTTPVPQGSAGRAVGDAIVYNGIAQAIMTSAGIPTHDLYTYALERQKELQREANVHFTDPGSEALGEEVARVILDALNR